MAASEVIVIVVMGVSGCGKTTIGKALARQLGCSFYDGDDFHPVENIKKMSKGIPLTDANRVPWLSLLQALIHQHLVEGSSAVLACSALKRRYRDHLRQDNDGIHFVYLRGDFATILARIQDRQGHYMKSEMLQSQFDSLEPPGLGEAIRVDITKSVEEITREILEKLGASCTNLSCRGSLG